MHRKISYLLFFLALLILLFMNSHPTITDEAIIIAKSEIYHFTKEELSQYNGENNQPAYIAIDNIIYDVSDLEEWESKLENSFLAGKDLSEIIEDPSMMEVIIENAPEVGILQE